MKQTLNPILQLTFIIFLFATSEKSGAQVTKIAVINIVDSVDDVNYGVWHAAIVNAALLEKSGIQTEIWFPSNAFDAPASVTAIGLTTLTLTGLQQIFVERKLDPANDIIVTDLLGKTLNTTFTKTSDGLSIQVPNALADIYLAKNINTGEAGKFVIE